MDAEHLYKSNEVENLLLKGMLVVEIGPVLLINMPTCLMLCSCLVYVREKNSVLGSQRRLERKLKELSMTLDEERHTHTEQRDQVWTFTSCCVPIFEHVDVLRSNRYTVKLHFNPFLCYSSL